MTEYERLHALLKDEGDKGLLSIAGRLALLEGGIADLRVKDAELGARQARLRRGIALLERAVEVSDG